MNLFDAARLIFLIAGFVGSGVFVVYYHFTSRWFQAPLSRYLMSGPLGLLSLYTAAMANSFIPEGWGRETVRLFMVFISFLFAWYSVFTYRRMRKDLKFQIKEREEDSHEG